MERHTMSLLVQDMPGVLQQVTSVSPGGYNVQSLAGPRREACREYLSSSPHPELHRQPMQAAPRSFTVSRSRTSRTRPTSQGSSCSSSAAP